MFAVPSERDTALRMLESESDLIADSGAFVKLGCRPGFEGLGADPVSTMPDQAITGSIRPVIAVRQQIPDDCLCADPRDSLRAHRGWPVGRIPGGGPSPAGRGVASCLAHQR